MIITIITSDFPEHLREKTGCCISPEEFATYIKNAKPIRQDYCNDNGKDKVNVPSEENNAFKKLCEDCGGIDALVEELAKDNDVLSPLLKLGYEFIKSIPAESFIDSLLEELWGKKNNKLNAKLQQAPKADTESSTPKDLKDTIEGMQSADYRERFKAEYFQTKIRYDKLSAMLVKAKERTLEFKPACSLHILKCQERLMFAYLSCLEERARVEGIELK